MSKILLEIYLLKYLWGFLKHWISSDFFPLSSLPNIYMLLNIAVRKTSVFIKRTKEKATKVEWEWSSHYVEQRENYSTLLLTLTSNLPTLKIFKLSLS